MPGPREEANKAIDHVIGVLDRPLDALGVKLAKATLEHAKEQVALIQEVKRHRRPAGAAPQTELAGEPARVEDV